MAERKGVLPKAVRQFMVEAAACFRTPTEVAEAVKERFGHEVSKQVAAHYDAEHSPDLAKEWRLLFAATRAKFLEGAALVAIAHQPFRLQELERIYRYAMTGRQKNLALALQALEQASKEKGGVFTNARILSGKLGLTIDDLLADTEPDAGDDE